MTVSVVVEIDGRSWTAEIPLQNSWSWRRWPMLTESMEYQLKKIFAEVGLPTSERDSDPSRQPTAAGRRR